MREINFAALEMDPLLCLLGAERPARRDLDISLG
jgi:hypothetical protein